MVGREHPMRPGAPHCNMTHISNPLMLDLTYGKTLGT